MVVFNNILAGASGATGAAGYEISRSLRFNSGDSAYLSTTPTSAGTSRTTWTISFWAKRAALGTSQWLFFTSDLTSNTTAAVFTANDTIEFYELQSASYVSRLITTAVFRDLSAWYNFVFTWDTSNGTSTDRARIYVNGVRLDTFSTATYPSSGVQSRWNNNVEHYFARGVGSEYFSGYLADVHFIDGQALAPTDFGEYDDNNVWQPKAYSGSYGTNGFRLSFSDNTSTTTIAEDSSGNNNDFTANNLSVAAGAGNDSLIDTPMNYEAGSGNNNGGNYCTWNPLKQTSGTYSDGNLQIATSSGNKHYQATFGLTSGKWYWEVTPTTGSTPGMIGIALDSKPLSNNLNGDSAMCYYSVTGNKQGGNTSGVDTSYGATYTYNDVIGVALDLDSATKTLTFYKNGVSQGVAFNPDPTLGSWHPAVSAGSSTNTTTFVANFGQRPFAYTPPSGHLAVVTTNLTDPAIADGSTAMDVKLWTGNGGTQTISGLGFSPDMVWVKCRSNGGTSHHITDAVRGANKSVFPNGTNAEVTYTNYLTAFTSDGFSVGSGSEMNFSGRTFVGWAWDAGTSTVSNTDGSITSSVRANPSAGFSVVSYTGNATQGATIGHGLNAVPEFMLVKRRDFTTYGIAYHKYIDATAPEDYFLRLFASEVDGGGARIDSSGAWFDTAPTSSVFTVSSSNVSNASGATYIAYIWAPVSGYSAMGSYTGNGSSDGAFNWTGMRPRFVMYKRSSSSGNWNIHDTSRNTYNQSVDCLFANLSNAETDSPAGSRAIDVLSNGFKIRGTDSDINANLETYVWIAFAEHPLKHSRAR